MPNLITHALLAQEAAGRMPADDRYCQMDTYAEYLVLHGLIQAAKE